MTKRQSKQEKIDDLLSQFGIAAGEVSKFLEIVFSDEGEGSKFDEALGKAVAAARAMVAAGSELEAIEAAPYEIYIRFARHGRG
jgi:hypothetical protein